MTAWLLQRFSAVLLLFFMFVHLLASHFPAREITFNDTLTRLAFTEWKLFYVAFLAVVLYHAMNGLWAVISDFDALARYRRSILAGVWLVGLVFLYLGAEVIWVFNPALAR
jgi:succinate dehydrogenase hydrophobic anchor subunit